MHKYITHLKRTCNFVLLPVLCAALISGCAAKEKDSEQSDKSSTQQSTSESKEKDSVVSPAIESVDLSNSFNGINGCAVLFDSQNNQYSFYNQNLCEQEVSPYSTFKIISTLAGLQNGVINDETSTMNYNGTQYPIPEWNGDLTLKTAFQASCIWYFRQVIDAVSTDEIANELNALSYGNCDVSEWNGSGTNPLEELNGFWLNSSLKISPLEQVQVLSKIFDGKSSYSEENITILKEIMLVNETDTQKTYGKTGSGSNGEAWFVGFYERQGEQTYFAIYLNDSTQKDNISGNTAKEIALKIIAEES